MSTITYTADLVKCRLFISDDWGTQHSSSPIIVSDNTVLTFSVSPDEGETFATAPTLNGEPMTKSKWNDDYSGDYTVNGNGTVAIVAHAGSVAEPRKITWDSELTNATLSVADSVGTPLEQPYTGDDVIDFTVFVTPINYEWDGVPTVNGEPMSQLGKAYHYELATDAVTKDTNYHVVAKGKSTVPPILFKVTQSHCTFSVKDGDTVPTENSTVTVTLEDGYKFDVNPTWGYYDEYGDYREGEFTATDNPKIYKAVLPLATNVPNKEVILKGEGVPKTLPAEYGFIRAYLPTDSELTALSQKRFHTASGETIDLSEFIVALHKTFAPLDSTETAGLRLGYVDIEGITPKIATEYLVAIECGTVKVPLGANLDTRFYVPFVGLVDIDQSYIAGKTVALRYKTNVLGGDAIAILEADGVEVWQGNCNISYDIPYTLSGFSDVVSSLTVNSEYLGGLIGKAITRTIGIHSSQLEYYQGDLVISGINATRNELDEIKNLLQGGVIIHE